MEQHQRFKFYRPWSLDAELFTYIRPTQDSQPVGWLYIDEADDSVVMYKYFITATPSAGTTTRYSKLENIFFLLGWLLLIDLSPQQPWLFRSRLSFRLGWQRPYRWCMGKTMAQPQPRELLPDLFVFRMWTQMSNWLGAGLRATEQYMGQDSTRSTENQST